VWAANILYRFLLQLKRLEKLGISKTDPKSLTPEEQRAFARLNVDVNTITWKRGE
jgi:methylenetetrahydrofolate dehydrogenase (NADP+)/methenyltetrahydrofolate cyclohydrolase/formyltetrahydrofolate synthetase